MTKSTKRGFAVISLIISLVFLAFIVVLVVFYLGRQDKAGREETTTPLARARSVECLAQIKKVEMQVHLYYVEKNQYPGELRSLEGISDSDLLCPVTQSFYLYDSRTGRLSCPDHTK